MNDANVPRSSEYSLLKGPVEHLVRPNSLTPEVALLALGCPSGQPSQPEYLQRTADAVPVERLDFIRSGLFEELLDVLAAHGHVAQPVLNLFHAEREQHHHDRHRDHEPDRHITPDSHAHSRLGRRATAG